MILSLFKDLKFKTSFQEERALLSEIDRAQSRKNVDENRPSVSDLHIKPVGGGAAPKENKQAAILRLAVKRKRYLVFSPFLYS